MNDVTIWYLIGLAQGVLMTLLVFRYFFRKYLSNWSQGWQIGEMATIDTIDCKDIDFVKHHGGVFPIVGFTPDRRACFIVPSGITIDERENTHEVRMKTYTMIVPLNNLHRVKT